MTIHADFLAGNGSIFAGQLFRRSVELVLLLIPLWIAAFLLPHPAIKSSFSLDHLHFLTAIVMGGTGLAGGGLFWRGYQGSGEVALRWLSLAFFASGVSGIIHDLRFLLPSIPAGVSVIFGTLGRLQLALGIFLAILHFKAKAETPGSISALHFLGRSALILMLVNGVLVVMAVLLPAAILDLQSLMSGLIIVLSIIAIAMSFRFRIDTPVMGAIQASLVLTAEAALIFLFGKPQNQYWWLAHLAFFVSQILLGYGFIRGYLMVRTVTANYCANVRLQYILEERIPTLECVPINPPEVAALRYPEYMARAKAEISRSAASGEPLSMMAVAIGKWGEMCRYYEPRDIDALFRSFIDRVHSQLRPLDVICIDIPSRVLILLPNTELRSAQSLAKQIGESVSTQSMPATSFMLHLKCHMALAQYGLDGESSQDIVDLCLYRLNLAISENFPIVSGSREIRQFD